MPHQANDQGDDNRASLTFFTLLRVFWRRIVWSSSNNRRAGLFGPRICDRGVGSLCLRRSLVGCGGYELPQCIVLNPRR